MLLLLEALRTGYWQPSHPTEHQMPKTAQTLYALLDQHADEQHSRRKAEIAALAPLLARVDEIQPTLAQYGLTIYADQVSLQRVTLDRDWSSPRYKVLRLQTGALFHHQHRGRWLDALRAAGLRVQSISTGTYPTAIMRKGSLLVCIDLSDPEAAAVRAMLGASAATTESDLAVA
jgi:hypothetical protein